MTALELCLRPEDTARLLRLPIFGRPPGRPSVVDRIWHDTPGFTLGNEGLELSLQKGQWRLERSRGADGLTWPLGTPSVLVAEAPALEALEHPLPDLLMPLAGFHGRQRRLPLADTAIPVEATLLEGALRGVTQERAVSRLTLTGPAESLQMVSSAIGAAIQVAGPRWPLAAEAIALARGIPAPTPAKAAPSIPTGFTLGDGIALVLGHLTDVILTGALTAAEGRSPDPVHQLRVAVRRMRSAMSIFRKAVDGAVFDPVKPGLKHLATVLGAARDWDVFLDGTGQRLAEVLPEEDRITAMLEAGRRRRSAAYTALASYLAGDDFRALELALVQLTVLRPWEFRLDEEQQARLSSPAETFTTRMLDRRLMHMLKPGPDIAALPVEELHAIRKEGKRLRYAAEFVAPLYGKRSTRRFIDRVSTLQEALGHLNDTASAGLLMDSLGRSADRQFAAGAVQGFVAAHQGNTRQDISDAWSKFRRQEPFWA